MLEHEEAEKEEVSGDHVKMTASPTRWPPDVKGNYYEPSSGDENLISNKNLIHDEFLGESGFGRARGSCELGTGKMFPNYLLRTWNIALEF
jgi:hypothetical protein